MLFLTVKESLKMNYLPSLEIPLSENGNRKHTHTHHSIETVKNTILVKRTHIIHDIVNITQFNILAGFPQMQQFRG